ncbi:hypothetical protein MTX80_23045 (plasmid) [Gordonia amicalis]|nr:hypothetical protein [Gordonia amicalis]UOG23799.1 hypothetical protein MTX80_23045 [Gordonia amicalis]
MDPGLAQLASESTQQACVLVLVCDASAPITAPEMEFVREASATVDALVLAVTKTDKHLGRWRQIVEENARLISHHLGREVPVIGVSSLLAVIAADTTDPQLQHRLEVDSGITALREAITTRLEATAAAPTRRCGAHLHRSPTGGARRHRRRTRRPTGRRTGVAGPDRRTRSAHRAASPVPPVGAIPRPRPDPAAPRCGR